MMAGKSAPKILLTYDRLLPFVERDLEVFKKHFKATALQYRGKKNLPRLAYSVARTNINFSWFVLGYATSSVLFSEIFRKKSVVIAGGWDVIQLPEIAYGAMNNPRRKKRTIYALSKADKILAVSESTKREVLDWVDRDVDVVYNGVDTNVFQPEGKKENIVITVAGINNEVRYRKKGIGALLKAAEKMPDTRFLIVGKNSSEWDQRMKNLAPENATITGPISNQELLAFYRRARVYAQVSFHESFGVALAEGMSCGCVPVATNRSALPEVVGDTGYYVDYDDVDGTVEAISKALEADDGTKCRRRIIEHFSIERRADSLIRIIRELTGS
jgi:glycosyltransferase involved in cell wall biosynthesis